MAECRYRGLCRIEHDADFDICRPCIGDGAETCLEYEPMPDTKALLAIADEMEVDSAWLLDVSLDYGDYIDRLLRRLEEAERNAERWRRSAERWRDACARAQEELAEIRAVEAIKRL